MKSLIYLLNMVVVFFAGSAVYLWLALNDIPYFRLEDIEPSLLIHGLVIAQGGGYNFALLFVSFFGGGWPLLWHICFFNKFNISLLR